MVEVKLRNNNNIITMIAPGKIPLQSSQGMIHYSPNELLCGAIGSCLGRSLVLYCAHNNINVLEFELIGITMNADKIIIMIKYPKRLEKEHIKELEKRVMNCELVTKLSKSFLFEVVLEKGAIEEVKRNETSRPCCGG